MALPKLYDRITWHNNTTPALNEDNLNAMSKGLDDLDDRVIGIAGTLMETVPEIIALYDDIRQLTEYPPYIGENGDWYVWDTDEDEFVDSGVHAQGETGVGIQSIEKTGTSGLVDTYTITFTDGSTTTFTVTNGSGDMQKSVYDSDGSVESAGGIKTYTANEIEAVYATNAVKNMLPTPYETTNGGSYSYGGITFVENSDGSVTANGTNTSGGIIAFSFDYEGNASNFAGKTITASIQNAPAHADGYCPIFFKNSSNEVVARYDIDAENPSYTFTVPSNAATFTFQVYIQTGKSINATLYPMIRLASIKDSRFQPYAKTNQQLTADTNGLCDNTEVNGAVNMLPNKATTQTINGITFTVNSDGTISASGTATANAELTLNTSGSSSPISGLETNNYKLSGCPSGGGSNTHRLFVKGTSNSYYNDDGSGVLINNDGIAYVRILIKSGQTVSNLVFKPMISLASLDLSYDDYVPYAKSNKELTEDVAILETYEELPSNVVTSVDTSKISNVQVTGSYRYGHIVILNLIFQVTDTVSAYTTYLSIASGYRPKNFVNAVLNQNDKAILVGVFPSGAIQFQSLVPVVSQNVVRGAIIYFI